MEARKAMAPDGPPTYSGPILDGRLVVETAESAYEAGHAGAGSAHHRVE